MAENHARYKLYSYLVDVTLAGGSTNDNKALRRVDVSFSIIPVVK